MSGLSLKNGLIRVLIIILLIIGFSVISIDTDNGVSYEDNYTEADYNNAIKSIEEGNASDEYKKYRVSRFKDLNEIQKKVDSMTGDEVSVENYNNPKLVEQSIKMWILLKESYSTMLDSFIKRSDEYLLSIGYQEQAYEAEYAHSEYIKKQLDFYEEAIKRSNSYINFYEYLLTIQDYISVSNGDIYIKDNTSLEKYNNLLDEIEKQLKIYDDLSIDLEKYEKKYRNKNPEYLF